jgi:hypothetical protein
MKVKGPKFLRRDDERVVIDVRRAALAGVREVEVFYDAATHEIAVEVRKSKGGESPKARVYGVPNKVRVYEHNKPPEAR